MSLLTIAIVLFATIAVGLVLTGFAGGREKAAKRDGTFANRYVRIEDDGSARELNDDERARLNGEWVQGDAPPIKESYDARGLDGRMGGFLERRKLPRKVVLRA